MNQQIVKGKWNEFKGEMRKMWGDLSDSDLERTKGNVQSIGGLLQQKYGQMKTDAKEKFDQLVNRFGEASNQASEQIKENLKRDEQNH